MRAIDADSGKVIWETRYPAPFKMNPATERHGPGPKSTPTYTNGRLFTLGMSGIVTAFDASTGKQLWQKPAPPVINDVSHGAVRAGRPGSRDPAHGRSQPGRADGIRSGHGRREMELEWRRTSLWVAHRH